MSNRSEDRSERRWGRRVSVDLPIRIDLAQGRSTSGRMRNASISGALIECPAELPVFTPLRVEVLKHANGASDPIRLAARVVRAEHPCLGVEWRDMEPQTFDQLLRVNEI